jgi:hypothetical protein
VTEVSQADTTDAADETGAFVTTITVLKGLVDVKQLDMLTQRPVGPTHSLGAQQRIRFTGVAFPRPVQTITPEDSRRLVREFRVAPRHAGGRSADVIDGQVTRATGTLNQILERSGKSGSADSSTGAGSTSSASSGVSGSGGAAADQPAGVRASEPSGKSPTNSRAHIKSSRTRR